MRATINFEVDVEKVETTMAALVSNQAPILRTAANILDNLGGGPLVNVVSEAIDLLQEASFLLHQYRDMLAAFERARLDTVIPQPSQETLENLDQIRDTITETRRNVESVGEVLSNIPVMDMEDIPAAEPVLDDDEFDPANFDPSQLKGMKDTVIQMRKFANFIKGAQVREGEENDETQEG